MATSESWGLTREGFQKKWVWMEEDLEIQEIEKVEGFWARGRNGENGLLKA